MGPGLDPVDAIPPPLGYAGAVFPLLLAALPAHAIPWSAADEAEAAAIVDALETAWPDAPVEVIVGVPPAGDAIWTGEDGLHVRVGGEVQRADAGPPAVQVVLVRSLLRDVQPDDGGWVPPAPIAPEPPVVAEPAPRRVPRPWQPAPRWSVAGRIGPGMRAPDALFHAHGGVEVLRELRQVTLLARGGVSAGEAEIETYETYRIYRPSLMVGAGPRIPAGDRREYGLTAAVGVRGTALADFQPLYVVETPVTRTDPWTVAPAAEIEARLLDPTGSVRLGGAVALGWDGRPLSLDGLEPTWRPFSLRVDLLVVTGGT